MNSTIQWSVVLPILLEILQASVLLLLTVAILRRRKLLVEPIGAMDYGLAIFCASILFGVLLISTGDSAQFLRTYKSALASDSLFQNTLTAFSKYFLVTLCTAIAYVGLTQIMAELIGGGKSREEMAGGNTPLGILCSGIAIGLAFALNAIAAPLYEWLTPVYLNFR